MNIVTTMTKHVGDRRSSCNEQGRSVSPTRSATLSTNELKRIVAAMLG
ncbi:hypothetical protein BV98_003309 [Sphingobium herbicidovorans NBRC 16415]|jgi:hypothetical protein|uniref:Uncharacterized protein n=1 Tax=Sphingobium herbicidovorans (strain ATCC 700291 / DSM 11019 / CCUG 56400 / KCTC 2939 / LMG 18315 / NBRC 16415 / MH) TaxID=1219045 RepID=A0A086P691_SPHHM|nr:hypothetical protein [Sphingobium herbicidovorans]KFG88909.1 hypothetical protein BV98_003309 [Sphingobium herbicidovorans NBRC 16415]